MKIKSAEFIKSEVDIQKFPDDGLFEIVLIGKSNVGKSSFINSMLNRNKLARTSSHPGRTQTANLYKINDQFYFVDMPGYGYAKVSKQDRADFKKLLNDYLTKRDADFMVFFLVDHRHKPTENDLHMYLDIKKCGIDPVLILTKSDKVKNSERSKKINEILTVFDKKKTDAIFPYSIDNAKQRAKVWAFIDEILGFDENTTEIFDEGR